MPSFKALRLEMALPSTELGPWDNWPLARLAAICAGVAMTDLYREGKRRDGVEKCKWFGISRK